MTWLILAGRGFGKTRSGAEWVRANVCGDTPLAAGKYRQLALIAETAADARDVLVGEGKLDASGILQVHPKAFRPTYTISNRRLTWPNGATATLYNATEPDQLRGPQHDAAWCDELCKWKYGRETWDNLQFGMRLGLQPRQVITTTPRPISLLKEIKADPNTRITTGAMDENLGNLAPTFVSQLIKKYRGTRLGRQELQGEILDDVPGALWTRMMIDRAILSGDTKLPDMQRIVVAVDPSGTKGDDKGDEIGIVGVGLGVDGYAYVLRDETCRLSPAGWAERVVMTYHDLRADRVVAETNFGGALVEHTVRTAARELKLPITYKEVKASRGKVARAEPVAALYEQHRVRHVGGFAQLEDQLVAFTPAGYQGEGSPDRADAVIWALTELMLGESNYDPSLSWVR